MIQLELIHVYLNVRRITIPLGWFIRSTFSCHRLLTKPKKKNKPCTTYWLSFIRPLWLLFLPQADSGAMWRRAITPDVDSARNTMDRLVLVRTASQGQDSLTSRTFVHVPVSMIANCSFARGTGDFRSFQILFSVSFILYNNGFLICLRSRHIRRCVYGIYRNVL